MSSSLLNGLSDKMFLSYGLIFVDCIISHIVFKVCMVNTSHSFTCDCAFFLYLTTFILSLCWSTIPKVKSLDLQKVSLNLTHLYQYNKIITLKSNQSCRREGEVVIIKGILANRRVTPRLASADRFQLENNPQWYYCIFQSPSYQSSCQR